MKRIFLIIFLLFIIPLLMGCAAKNRLIAELETEVDGLKDEFIELQDDLIKQKDRNETLKATISDLEARPTVTPTPVPTPQPTPRKTYTALDVVDAFIKAGLPVVNAITYDESTDPNLNLGRPGQYISKTNFNDNRIRGDKKIPDGGMVEVFANVEDMIDREEYIKSVQKAYPTTAQYVYGYDLVLLRLNFDLLPVQAEAYEEALKAFLDDPSSFD